MRVISWAVSRGGIVVSVHYEARVTPSLKGGMEWGSAPMLPSEAGVGKPPVDHFARVGEVQLRPADSVTARRARLLRPRRPESLRRAPRSSGGTADRGGPAAAACRRGAPCEGRGETSEGRGKPSKGCGKPSAGVDPGRAGTAAGPVPAIPSGHLRRRHRPGARAVSYTPLTL